MKKLNQTLLMLILAFALVGTAYATVGSVQKSVDYTDIKISLNGTEIIPKDSNGNTVEPFAIEGTTYLPVRAVANALGLEVGWDQATKTVILTTPDKQTTTPADTSGATIGQTNALRKANSYLSLMSFSRKGLIDQLIYEGFSEEDSTYAADHCGADWNEQAAKKAESYLKLSGFSRDGLIDQLLFEGFTQAQAEYGVAAVGY